MPLNFKVATCPKCKQSVNITTFISDMSTYNVLLAAELAIKFIERRPLTEDEELRMEKAFAQHTFDKITLSSKKCSLCLQFLPQYKD